MLLNNILLIEETNTTEEVKEDKNLQKALEKAEEIKHFDDLEIEIAGCWIWISGNTREHKEELKELGFKYASKKQMWYYNPDTSWKRRGTKGKDGKYTYKDYTIEEIHDRYETRKIK